MNLLAVDLGGTKSLLAIFKWNKVPVKIHQKRYISSEWNSFYSILNDFITTLPGNIDKPKYGCIALAGNTNKNNCKITNLNWEISTENIYKIVKLKKIELINDLAVLVYGLKYFKKDQYTTIQEGNVERPELNNSVIAIIGAGTGLGIARGLKDSNGFHSLSSEGGHSEFSPRSQDEWDLAKWLKNDLKVDRLSLERIVSGTGLGHIARWQLLKEHGKMHPLREIAEKSTPYSSNTIDIPAIASKAARNGDSLMLKALDIWLSAYGSAAGDLALQELCTSGLWIAGGTAGKHINGLKSKIFLDSFINKGRFKAFLKEIPIKALIDPDAGVFSAGCRAYQVAQQNEKLN
tara:strand:- start:29269 stop:30312 length:1044 start_codon:yes stop_codon:yes gene_type:complete